MKCLNCGNELSNDAQFCDRCGYRVQNSQESTNSFCRNCGAELKNGVQFCGKCGSSVYGEQGYEATGDKFVKKKRRTGMAIAIMLVVICASVAAISIGYMIYFSYNDRATSNDIPISALKTDESQNKSSENVNSSDTPNDILASDTEEHNKQSDGDLISSRVDLYDSSLTYKRMSEIHNTVLTNDETFNELKAVIIDFDTQCADYMNGITNIVPQYLKVGTTAYKQQVEYKQKHPILNQSYQRIDVINARQGGGYYYVWVTEVMNVNENGNAKVTTNHWVYKIENDNGFWYICDYTTDPVF